MPQPQEDSAELLEIWAAMEDGIRRYIAERRERVAPFCARYYSWEGMRGIHLGSRKEDFVTHPLNILWAVPHALLRSGVEWCRRLGWFAPVEWFKRVPVKLRSGSQRKVERLLLTELLELPFKHRGWQSRTDALADEFYRNPKLAALKGQPEWAEILHTSPHLWRHELVADSNERSAPADLAGGIATLLAGWWFIGNAWTSVFGMGEQYARRSAHDEAVENFSLWGFHLTPTIDHKLGTYYYRFFPPNPTGMQIVLGTAIIMLGIAGLSLVLHAVVDPLQQKMGVHEKRTQRFLDALETRLLTNVRTHMAARIFASRPVKSPEAGPKSPKKGTSR